jgi:hypothetical protein
MSWFFTYAFGLILPLFLFRKREKAAEKEKLKWDNGYDGESHMSQSKFFWAPFLSRKGAPASNQSLI